MAYILTIAWLLVRLTVGAALLWWIMQPMFVGTVPDDCRLSIVCG